MSTKLFVGSLSWNTSDESLAQFFATVGTVVSAKVIRDRDTNKSRGFGFVEMSTPEEAEKAKNELNGQKLDDRNITVNEARPQEDRGPRNFSGGRSNYGGGDRRDDRRSY
jgi:RNA recognition motif-containing protein